MNNNNNTNDMIDLGTLLNAVVIDMDTGTILNTNLRVVLEADLTDEEFEVLENGTDAQIAQVGYRHGRALYTRNDA